MSVICSLFTQKIPFDFQLFRISRDPAKVLVIMKTYDTVIKESHTITKEDTRLFKRWMKEVILIISPAWDYKSSWNAIKHLFSKNVDRMCF